ncbi:PREDICTED: elastase-1-like [Calidris pugnax]|uniref:elastase-1-like n=1 Tax=Calidris pugnax TaxID=198806 RepID=UPI00071DB58C|nr:PREDICTED: elastase-1-like [Calidris pugnax]
MPTTAGARPGRTLRRRRRQPASPARRSLRGGRRRPEQTSAEHSAQAGWRKMRDEIYPTPWRDAETPLATAQGAGEARRCWILNFERNISYHSWPPGATYRVALGEHDLLEVDGTEYYIGVDRIFIHNGWNPNDIANGYDIALLRLDSPAYDNGFVELGMLPSEGDVLPNNYPCYITGWGVVSVGGGSAVKLQEVMLPVVDHEICSQNDWWGSQVKATMICAGGDGVRSGCSGDSGGPLNCYTNNRWQVHGIVSYGLVPYCNTYKKPTVFTRVSAYVDWIYSTTMNNGGF